MSQLYARETGRLLRPGLRFQIVVVDVYQRGAGPEKDDIKHLAGLEVVAPRLAKDAEVDALVAAALLQLQAQAHGEVEALREDAPQPPSEARRARRIEDGVPAPGEVAAVARQVGLAVELQELEYRAGESKRREAALRGAAEALLDLLPEEEAGEVGERVKDLAVAVGREPKPVDAEPPVVEPGDVKPGGSKGG